MIPKFRCFVGNKRMFEVEAIDFVEKEAQVPVYDKDTGEYLASASFNFDDIILMQSTGLFDKNGNEIFEGDVVEIPSAGIIAAKVVYTRGIFSVDGDRFPLSKYDDVTVLGNIHESPELAEGI